MKRRKKLLTMKSVMKFLQKNFNINNIVKEIRDERTNPQISTETIFKAGLYSTILGKGKAFLQMDQILREPLLAKLISKTEKMPSDTTIIRVLNSMDTEAIRKLGRNIFNKYISMYKSDAKIKLPSGRRKLLGAVDGTFQSKRWYSVFGLINRFGINLIDAERYEMRGKELEGSHSLMNRLYPKLGFGFIDILVVDNLYATQDFINHTLAHETNCVVKLSDKKNYLIAREAERLISGGYNYDNAIINHIEKHIDTKRGYEYEIFSVNGLYFSGVKKKVKLLKVIERKIDDNTGEPEIFYLLSTDTTLTDLDILEIFHLRWHIENNGFKLSNAVANTKHTSSKDDVVALNILLIKILAVFLLNVYYFINKIKSVLRNYHNKVKVTFTIYFITFLCSSIITAI